MIERLTVLLFVVGLLGACYALCDAIARWSLRTPRSGYLITTTFALYVLSRSLP